MHVTIPVYNVNFNSMTQTNTITGFQRKLRTQPSRSGGDSSAVTDARKKPRMESYSVWQWQEGRRWNPYDRTSSSSMEKAFSKAITSKLKLQFGHNKYEIDFQRMEQKNCATGFSRKIRRIKASDALPRKASPSKTLYFHAVDKPDWGTITGWSRVRPPAYDPAEKDLMDEPLGNGNDEEPVVKLSCSTDTMPCIFRQSFISKALSSSTCCPNCKFSFHVPGPQPSGEMTVDYMTNRDCSGYTGAGTIALSYRFPSGTQGLRMQKPGARYSGTRRAAYLPNTAEGKEVCELLQKAFMQGELFIVGDSVTTGQKNTTVWSGIHQKTSLRGGATNHGWPDPGYFERVKHECASHSVYTDKYEAEEREARRKEKAMAEKKTEAIPKHTDSVAGDAAELSGPCHISTESISKKADGRSSSDLEKLLIELSNQLERVSAALQTAMRARDVGQIRSLMAERNQLLEQRRAFEKDLGSI